ncbi:MAG: histidinol-phosphatase HisJ family protein [Clostridia bacterium]|nr:histidinol-phosphatase HisJ family protein [Clostridia bacterium]
MFDCHLHSNFSGDSQMSVDEACEKAISLGLKGIAFTDHLDYDYPDYEEVFMINFDQYSKFMDQTKLKYNHRLKVLKGIEVGIQPHVLADSEQVVTGYDFDFVIGSTHIIDKLDPYTGSYFAGKTKKQSDTRYLEEVLFAVENFKNYDVVGHIGYIRRYNQCDDKTLRYVDYHDLIDTILKTVIRDGKGIEVNTSGFKGILNTPIPDFDILKRYKELGGEIITLGSDAHSAEHIALNFNFVKDQLKQIGFKTVTYFEKRKPVFINIE